jgi:deoxyribodipyrimidine photo-lyase
MVSRDQQSRSVRSQVPALRVRSLNDAPVRISGSYVLYWMTFQRRMHWNFALQRARDWARSLERPLLVVEPLRLRSRWASDRMHRFVLQGMADNQVALADTKAAYFPYVEPGVRHGHGLFAALAATACLVVTDDFPCAPGPAVLQVARRHSPVLLEAVDSNGLLPLRAAECDFPTAYSFRRFLQKGLREHLSAFPQADPLRHADLPVLAALPAGVSRRWPQATEALLSGNAEALSALPIEHQIGPAAMRGGSRAAQQTLQQFLKNRFYRYDEDRNQPDRDAASGLSPYLHFGHLAAHEVVAKIWKLEDWKPDQLSASASGQRDGWWGLSPAAESFLDELITWRELGYNMCAHRHGYDRYESLPDWALKTLARHAADPRDVTYTLDEFAAARTHDEIWNAAQRQLVQEGRMQNYLRMLWGKKILEWTASPRQALQIMIELNNRYAVDGRNPNSYSGIFWVLGRYDRAWGPERPVFGTIRYMSSDSTRRKLKMKAYLERFGENRQQMLPLE